MNACTSEAAEAMEVKSAVLLQVHPHPHVLPCPLHARLYGEDGGEGHAGDGGRRLLDRFIEVRPRHHPVDHAPLLGLLGA